MFKTFSIIVVFNLILWRLALAADTPSIIKYTENKGQWEKQILFRADVHGGRMFMEKDAITHVSVHPYDVAHLHPHDGYVTPVIRMHAWRQQFIGTNVITSLATEAPLSTTANYFLGKDSSHWKTAVKSFRKTIYPNLYNGIDLHWYSSGHDPKSDFIVRPYADPDQISYRLEGLDAVQLVNNELHLTTSVGTVVEQAPFAYQVIGTKIIPVKCKYVLKNNIISFKLNKYNHAYPLIIDPTLVFASYTGSLADNWGFTATYDSDGNLYTGGNVQGAGYPTSLGAYQVTYGGGGFGGNGWMADMAIAKFSSNGAALLYATYLGGSDNEQPQSLVVNASNELIIFGTSYSTDYPTTAGAYDEVHNGVADIVVTKLNSSGSALVGSTFIGGSGSDGINANHDFFTLAPTKYNYGDESRGEVICDNSGNIFVASSSKSINFPIAGFVFQNALAGDQDGVIFQLNPDLTNLVWSSYFGGVNDDAVFSLSFDGTGNLVIAGGTESPGLPVTPGAIHPNYQGGTDGFIARIFAGGSFIFACTYIGTPQYDQTFFVQADDSGFIYTMGQTEGAYPVTPGAYANPGSGQFIHKLDPLLSATVFSTVFGDGTNIPNISPSAFLVDTCKNIYVSGWGRCLTLSGTPSNNVAGMPITFDALQATTNGCDFYFMVLDRTASNLLYGTFFGGASSGEHVDGGTSRFDKNGVIYQSVCAGCPGNDDFPTTAGVVSQTNNSSNCNNGVVKINFELTNTTAALDIGLSQDSGCAPLTINFNNNSLGAVTFTWLFGDGFSSNDLDPTHTYNDTGTFIITLIAENLNTCNLRDTAYDTIRVTLGGTPDAIFNSTTSLPCATPQVTLNFTGTLSNAQYLKWNFGDGTALADSLTTTHTFAGFGSYQVSLIVTDTSCGLNNDTAFQTFNYFPPIDAVLSVTNDSVGCSPLNYSATRPANDSTSYTWINHLGILDTNQTYNYLYNDTGLFNLYLIAFNPNSCNVYDTAIASIQTFNTPDIVPTITWSQSYDCDSLSAVTAFTGSGGQTYQWHWGDASVSYGLNASHQYNDDGSYAAFLIIQDTLCYKRDSVSFNPNFKERLIIQYDSATRFVCVPFQTTLFSSNSPQGAYQWTLPDGSFNTAPSITASITDSGRYVFQLTITDTTYCNLSDTATFIIDAGLQPIAEFNYTAQDLYFAGQAIRFTDSSSFSNSYLWQLSDGNAYATRSFDHVFLRGGLFTICDYAIAYQGCADTLCKTIEIIPEELIYAPNSFTPNGDGINDQFQILHTGLLAMNVIIYNRWGQEIYQWNTLDGGWNGEYNGNPVHNEVYTWQLKGVGVVNKNIERNGKIAVLR